MSFSEKYIALSNEIDNLNQTLHSVAYGCNEINSVLREMEDRLSSMTSYGKDHVARALDNGTLYLLLDQVRGTAAERAGAILAISGATKLWAEQKQKADEQRKLKSELETKLDETKKELIQLLKELF